MTTAPPLNTAFSQTLRARSWELHRNAEGSGYLRALMAGELDRDAYAALVAQEWFVYVTLDGAGRELRSHPMTAPFLATELRRVAGLEADLHYLLGGGWRRAIVPGAATSRYVRRIQEVGTTWPAGFVAHHYTRYLGDLSGGQAIAAVVARHYGFTDGQGVRSYEFPSITSAKGFKDNYRAKLDAAPWSEAEREQIINEVLLAYRLNTELLDELAGTLDLPVRP